MYETGWFTWQNKLSASKVSKNHLKKKQESWLFYENLPLLASKPGEQMSLEESIAEHLENSALHLLHGVEDDYYCKHTLISDSASRKFSGVPSQWGNI